ncbi:MAG: MBL fold metallo-hydrolase, partial [Ginsengibacter sp.]
AFENAEYYVNKNEWAYALENESLSYKRDNFLLLERYSKTNFLEGDGVIDDYIYYEVSGAHSPYHQVFKIVENDEIVFFGADVAPQLMQMKNKFKAKYDYDGQKSMELRQKWWKQGQEENWDFLFYHDLKSPVFKIDR